MAKWFFEPGHTAAEFCARHMMVTCVRGHFKDVHGTLDFDPENPSAASLEVTIDASRIWSGEPDRDAHLKSADFLDVENHPKITFRGKGVELTGKATGTLVWSSKKGLQLEGGVSLTIDIPLNLELGPIELVAAHATIAPPTRWSSTNAYTRPPELDLVYPVRLRGRRANPPRSDRPPDHRRVAGSSSSDPHGEGRRLAARSRRAVRAGALGL